MNGMEATLVMLALFALRCIIPPAVALGICYLMNRLVDYWEAQEAAEKALGRATARAREEKEEQEEMTRQEDSRPLPMPPAFAFSPALLALPCWLINNCPEGRRENCAAFLNRDIPCWKARRQTEGALPADCPDCPRYTAANVIA